VASSGMSAPLLSRNNHKNNKLNLWLRHDVVL
jgi:hypothetical protein